MNRMYYILENKITKPCENMEEYYRWSESNDRVVRKTYINNCEVSTVFLGLDHSYEKDGSELFETMIFGGEEHGYEVRCATWEEAEAQHQHAIEIIMSEILLKTITTNN